MKLPAPPRRCRRSRSWQVRAAGLALLAGAVLLLAACGGGGTPGEDTGTAAEEEPAQAGGLRVVATTSILGDIVQELVGDDGEVEVLMPPGVDPHAFQASAAEAATLREVDLVVANGLGLEESLRSALGAAADDGVRVFELAEQLDPLEYGAGASDPHGDDDGHDDDGHDDDPHGDDDGHDDDPHGDDDGHDDDGHDHGPLDPHVWLDPVRMADGVRLLAAELAAVDQHLDAQEWERRGERYAEEILSVHRELEGAFDTIAEERRKLVTNHDALGYLASRYDLEVIGTVIPGSSTQAEADARGFSALIETVDEAGVTAIFAENVDSAALAEQVASEIRARGGLEVEVVSLYTDALGEQGSGAETYLGLLRTNAERITDALG